MKTIVISLITGLACLAGAAPEKRTVDGVVYHVLRTRPEVVRIVWKDDQGNQMRTFAEAARHLREKGKPAVTLMNGGIFEPGGIPSGLLVQDGKEWRPLNRKVGTGNFYLKPNGVFLVGSKGAAVIRTEEYPPHGVVVRHAVQSGPLLLRQGKVHPAFRPQSASRLHRNGVGATTKGEVVFAMTDFHSPKFPNLHEFAMLFRALGCEDALFLDGDLSQMRSGKDLEKNSNSFGSMIAVVASE